MSFSASFSLHFAFILYLLTNGERKEERRRPKKRELHELLYYKKIVKFGTIRLASHCRVSRSKNVVACPAMVNG